jgi:hypothetical protein
MKKNVIGMLAVSILLAASVGHAFDSLNSNKQAPQAQQDDKDKKGGFSSTPDSQVECNMETASCMRVVQEAALNYIVTGAPLSEGMKKAILDIKSNNPEYQNLSDQDLINAIATQQ